MRISPRAATGTLDELFPVAPLTTPPGEIAGVTWAGSNHAAQRSPNRNLDAVRELVRQRLKRRRLAESGSALLSRPQYFNNVKSRDSIRMPVRTNGTYALIQQPDLFFAVQMAFMRVQSSRARLLDDQSRTKVPKALKRE
jgi:hypothetical protein